MNINLTAEGEVRGFFTAFNRPPRRVHPGGGKVITETAGFITRKERIENLILAGQRLQAYRESAYMYKDNSLAERDTGMPSDIFKDEIEATDEAAAFFTEQAAKADQGKEAPKEEPKATTTDPTSPGDAKPNGPEE